MTIRVARRLDGVERTLIRRMFDAAPPGSINLGLGQPDLATPPAIALAGISGIAAGRTAYTSTSGDADLRTAVAAQYGLPEVGADDVLITVGSQEAMFACCLALVDPGEEILYPDPGYPSYPVVAALVGARAVTYPLPAANGFRPRASDIEKRLSERTRLVILNSPSNPTGASVDPEEARALVRLLEARGIAWLSDEIYSGFRYAGGEVSPLRLSPEGGVVVSGLSKDLSMTGWRVGWVVGTGRVVGRVAAVHQHLVTCAPSVSQRAALAAFTPEGRRARRRIQEVFSHRRELMAEELSRCRDVSFEMPDGAFYFFVDVSRHGDELELSRAILERRGVITIPGRAFGEAGRGYLRLSFAAGEQEIRRGIEGIRAELG